MTLRIIDLGTLRPRREPGRRRQRQDASDRLDRRRLRTLPGAGETIPLAINNRGVVLGSFRTPEGLHAGNFVWADGVLTRLDPRLFATDINDRGQIAASAPLPAGGGFGALILDRGTIVRLPGPSEPVNCVAEAINQRGDVGGGCVGSPAVWVRGELKTLAH